MHGRRAASRGQGLTEDRDKWERSWAIPAEDFRWFRARIEPIITSTATSADLPPGVAVDVGCGAGVVTRFLGERFPLAVGLDLAFLAVEQARTRGDGQHTVFGVADATMLPLGDHTASLVVDRGCLHCLSIEGASAYLDEVARVLSPGGRFVLVARTAMASPPIRWVLRHPRGAVRRLLPRVRKAVPGSLTHALRSLDPNVSLLPDTLAVEHVEHERLRSDSGWHLRHLRLVARRVPT